MDGDYRGDSGPRQSGKSLYIIIILYYLLLFFIFLFFYLFDSFILIHLF